MPKHEIILGFLNGHATLYKDGYGYKDGQLTFVFPEYELGYRQHTAERTVMMRTLKFTREEVVAFKKWLNEQEWLK